SGRNWDYRYCWLRDSAFTLGALRRLGQFEEMQHFINYLGNIASGGEGRLQPVYSISGERKLEEKILKDLPGYNGNGPVRIGNDAYLQAQNDVFGEMLASIAPLFLDVRFDDHARAWSTGLFHKLIDSVEQSFDLPDASLWEKRQEPKVHTFTLLMNWAGARAAANVGRRTRDDALATRGEALCRRAQALIDATWREKLGFYADSPDSMDADASLFMLVNLGFLTPDNPHAERHIVNLARRLAAHPPASATAPAGAANGLPSGVTNGRDYLLYRYLHDDGIGATHATFTVCGFWYAEALARVGKVDEARRVFNGLMSHANHVGLLSEDIDPVSGALWGNFPQTYSHVGIINAAFAISPAHSPLI
ncbi:MAG TPA: glycoside hydrolase family 15 protein, partial [Kofleriaceae bacterium]|nr:glycoside hydrolase family 15 protein [Kofleriaceae bacterium]